jgi:hypothetical protein
MIGCPKYDFGDIVKFKLEDKELSGAIGVVDKYGTFFDNSDVSYDIMVFEPIKIFYKHLSEKYIIEKIGHTERYNPIEGYKVAVEHGFKYVPIVDTKFKIPKTCEELLSMAGGMSEIDGGMREGIVCRSYDGVKSFKAVDNEYLLKYHN